MRKTKLLVDKGAQVNVAAKNGTTPPMVAASALGNTSGVRYLLAHGADAKAADMLGAMHLSVRVDERVLARLWAAMALAPAASVNAPPAGR